MTNPKHNYKGEHMTDTFLENQLIQIETQIGNLNAAVTFLTLNPHKSYTLDSGQNRTTVTRNDLSELIDQIEKLMNLRSILLVRINPAVSLVQPFY